MQVLAVDVRHARSCDGAQIAYRVIGKGRPVLCANGLAAGWRAWAPQLEYFSHSYRFLIWDYRGFCESVSAPAAQAMSEHALDGLAVVRAEGITRVAVAGWSMGVGVALEMFRAAPEAFAALVMVNGTARAPWRGAGGRIGTRLLRHVVVAAERTPTVAEALLRRFLAAPDRHRWARRLGLVRRPLDETALAELGAELATVAPATYLRTLTTWAAHDATDVLQTLDVPTLMIVGEHDPFTPGAMVEEIANRIGGLELLTLPGAAHCVTLECAEHVNLRVEKFFREWGYGSTPR